MNAKALSKRIEYVIKQLHEINEIKKLAEFSKEQALVKALENQHNMAENLAPFLIWQKSINALVQEIQE